MGTRMSVTKRVEGQHGRILLVLALTCALPNSSVAQEGADSAAVAEAMLVSLD